MSLHDYETSKNLTERDPSFYALVMAAMRRADSANLAKLKGTFPDTWRELQARYNAPGGVLPEEIPDLPDGVTKVRDRDGDQWVKVDGYWALGVSTGCASYYTWADLLLTYGPMTYEVDGHRVTVRAAV